MPRIATNMFRSLTEEEQNDIKKAGRTLGEIEISEYVQKELGTEEIIKFIFDDFNLRNVIRDALLWDSLKSLLGHMFNLISRKLSQPAEIQIWIRDITNPAGLNISFSIKQKQEIQDLLIILRTKLEDEIFSKNKEQEKGKIFWIAFDRERKNWLIKIL